MMRWTRWLTFLVGLLALFGTTGQPAWGAQAEIGERRLDAAPARAASQPLSASTPDEPATTPAANKPAPQRVLQALDLKGLSWRSVGPANMGGRVADIAVAPSDPKTYYVAFGTGGLFKTTNNGTTFNPVFDKEATASIGSVIVADAPPDWPGWKDQPAEPATATAPADPREKGKSKIVWVGTGEGNGRNSSSWGHGVYRSTDGGATFANVGLTDSHDIPRMAVDPRNPDVCYVAALGHLWGPNQERGVYKTTDGGKNWQAVLQIDENTGACDVLLDPQSPDTVYAAMYMRRRAAYSFRSGGPQGGVYRSTDAGATWTKLTEGLPAQTGRIGIDIYLKNPRVLYAVIESDLGGQAVDPFDNRSKSGGVFRTENGGDTWTRINEFNPRPFYFSKIRIDPTDDQRIYLLGWGLAISDDGGKNFRAGGAKRPHVDLHALVVNPVDRDHLLMGTDGGLYVSYDRAKTWEFHNHLAVGEFYNVAVDRSDPYRIGGGLQDNGTWIGPSESQYDTGGEKDEATGITNCDWRFINNGDGFHVAFDPTDPNIVFAEWQGGELVRVHLDTGKRRRLKPSPKEGQQRFRFNWNTPFFISPHDPTILYVGGNCVFKLTQKGDRWERISDDLSTRAAEKIDSVGSDAETHGTVVALAESPPAAGMLWAGTDDGLVHLTIDGGKNWTNVTPPQAGGLYISRIEASHHERDTAYVSIDGHRSDDMEPRLFMTADAGKSWQSIAGDLPAGSPVKVVREDLKNPNVLYVGTEQAVYVSIDRGRRWGKLNGESLPTVAVDDIVQHPREMDLIVGTHGRSIYVLDDASALSNLTPQIVERAFALLPIMPAKPRLYLPYGGLWSDREFRVPNPPLGAAITYWIRDYTGEEVKVVVKDAKGTLVRKLSGPNRPGLNRVMWDLQPEKEDRFDNPDAMLGQKDFVPPGEYIVTATCGKEKGEQKVTVLPGAWEKDGR